MLCTGLFPNADTKIQHRRRPTCPLWYDKYQLCSIWLNYAYFCMWFKYGLKAQKLLAQGNALGIMPICKAPCKGKSFIIAWSFEAFALTGRFVDCHYTQGVALG